MKTIVLKRLVLRNWRSLNLDVTFNRGETKVCGRNGVGKSSLQYAWNWLLCGYTNATQAKNHSLFDNREELTHETPIASVKAWVEVDGFEYTIEKTAQAKFSRKRGSDVWEKDASDVYKIYIDEIETTATNYAAWIEHNICGTDMLPYCLDGFFFAVLSECDRKKSRKVLENIVGEITEHDFKGDYSVLANDFAKGYSIEQIEERTKNQIKPLKKRQEDLPTLIDIHEKKISQILSTPFEEIERNIQSKRDAIAEIDNVMLGNTAKIKPILGKRDAMFEIIDSKTRKLNECRNTYNMNFQSLKKEIQGKISDVKQSLSELVSKKTRNEAVLRQKEMMLANLAEKRELLVQRKNTIKERVFNGDKCAYCGQTLPEDMIAQARAQFNKQKQEDLDACVAQGKNIRLDIDNLTVEIEELKSKISIASERASLDMELENLTKQLSDLESSHVLYENTEEYNTLFSEIENLKRDIPEVPNSNMNELTITKRSLIAELEELNAKLGHRDIAMQMDAELECMRVELRDISINIAALEGVLDKCSEYVEERANIISNRINDKLKHCKIQMWETQKNGEQVPSCIITDNDGVRYSTLNNSARIKTCISLQELFCSHYEVVLPTFIDEYSIFSSNNEVVLDRQNIKLYASDDITLKIQ